MIEEVIVDDWVKACESSDLIAGTGVAVSLGDEQVAIFKLRKDESVYAISNYDPIGKANVLSRGITGSIGDRVVVSSPLYKQHFDLKTGECLENQGVKVKAYPVRVYEGSVQLQYAD